MEMKLKTFKRIQSFLAIMGFTPNQRQNSPDRRLNCTQVVFVVICIINTIFLTFYIFLEADDIVDYTDAIFSLTVVAGVAMAFVSIILKNDDLFDTIELNEMEVTLRSNYNPASRVLFEKTNRIIEKSSEIFYFAAIRFGLPGLILPKTIISYVTYFTTDVGSAAFQTPFVAWLPFEWHNPIGYFFAVIWVSIITLLVLLFLGCMPPFAFGAFLFALAFAKDFKGDLRTINEMAHTKQPKVVILKRINEFVRSYSNVAQMIKKFENICEVSILAEFSCSTITLCVVMLMIQAEILSNDAIDPAILWKSIFLFFSVFGLVFVSCEIGQRLTDRFVKIQYDLEKLDWYLFPIEIQRMLSIILIGVQKPIVVGCFGIVEGSRDQSKKVANTVYKVFNILRRIYN